jgi:hypothetical protein
VIETASSPLSIVMLIGLESEGKSALFRGLTGLTGRAVDGTERAGGHVALKLAGRQVAISLVSTFLLVLALR